MSGTFRYITFIAILILGSLAALVFIMNPPSESVSTVNITVHYNPVSGANVELYHSTVDNSGNYIQYGDAMANIVSDSVYTVKPDIYLVVVSGNDIEPHSTTIDASKTSQNTTISIDRPSNTLKNIAKSESHNIYNTLASGYQNLSLIYTSTDIRVYGDGSWASITLRYAGKGQQSRDTLYSVLHKQSGNWVVTTKPKISISRGDVPSDTPLSLLRHVVPGRIDVKSLQNAWTSS